MSTSFLLDAISSGVGANLGGEAPAELSYRYPVLTEVELLQLIAEANTQLNNPTMRVAENYSDRAFILRTATHNQLIHEDVPSGSFVMIEPGFEASDNSIMAFALPDQNAIALGIRDPSWQGYFISFGSRASHITNKRCVPLWPVVAVIGYDLTKPLR